MSLLLFVIILGGTALSVIVVLIQFMISILYPQSCETRNNLLNPICFAFKFGGDWVSLNRLEDIRLKTTV